MIGMNKNTGLTLEGIAHLRQSIEDILTTPKGTRVMRRNYGSNLPRLVDAPLNRETLIDIYGETAQALEEWEPRLKIKRVQATNAGPGWVELSIEATYLPNGKPVTIDGVMVK